MANSKGSSNIRNLMFVGKHALLPPKSPFPIASPSYADYASNTTVGSKPVPQPRDGHIQHQRTSSESHLIEEQPSWLDDLLNEPETPVRRGGHRRSSSDSFAYIDGINVSNIDYHDDFKHKKLVSAPSWTSQGFDQHTDILHTSFYAEANLGRQKNSPWVTAMTNPSTLSSARSNIFLHSPGSLSAAQERDGVPCLACDKQSDQEPALHDSLVSERVDGSHAKPSASDPDDKRAKQQFAQRSRVRKLHYIAELERNVQALQVEGSDFSAELEFLNQQNLILSMENKALKQRVESIAQEQLIKQLEQEVLEREIGRLRALYQQQQQQPQQPSGSSHRRNKSRDLDTQFTNLSLKHKDATSSGREAVTGPLHI